jgi:hypothetical protein
VKKELSLAGINQKFPAQKKAGREVLAENVLLIQEHVVAQAQYPYSPWVAAAPPSVLSGQQTPPLGSAAPQETKFAWFTHSVLSAGFPAALGSPTISAITIAATRIAPPMSNKYSSAPCPFVFICFYPPLGFFDVILILFSGL